MLFFCEKAGEEVFLDVHATVKEEELEKLFNCTGTRPIEGQRGTMIKIVGLDGKNKPEEDRWYDIPYDFWENFKLRPVSRNESRIVMLEAKPRRIGVDFLKPHNSSEEDEQMIVEDEKTEEEIPKLSLAEMKDEVIGRLNDSLIERITNKYIQYDEKNNLIEDIKNRKKWKKISKREIHNMFMDIETDKLNERIFGLKTIENRLQMVVYTDTNDSKIIKANYKLTN